jgi:hypothetical protein
VPIWRREKPAHEELAEGTDLLDWEPREGPASSHHMGFLDVLHGGRPRSWDAVATAEAPGLEGDELEFTALPDGTLLVDVELPDGALSPLADALEQSVTAPYRARAVRSEGDVWGVAANRIDVIEVPEEIEGDTVSLAVKGDQRTFLIDDRPGWGDVPTLESYALQRHREYVLHAERLDGDLWSVKVNAL